MVCTSCLVLPFLLGWAMWVLNQCALVCCRCFVSCLACHCCLLCGAGLVSARRWLGVLLFCGGFRFSLKRFCRNRQHLWVLLAVAGNGGVVVCCCFCLLRCCCSRRCERVRPVRS